MRLPYYCALSMLVVLTGCAGRPRGNVIELMGAERRWTEDLLRETQDKLRERSLEVARLRKAIRKMKEQAGEKTSSTAPLPDDRGPLPDDRGDLQIDYGSVSQEPDQHQEDAESAELPATQPVEAETTGPVTRQARVGRRVATRVFVDSKRSKVENWDGQPGVDGISIVLGFVDENGQPGRAVGDVLIELFPDNSQPHDRPVADWQVSRVTMDKLLKASKDGRVRLELDWPERRPPDGKWIAMVEYATDAEFPQQASYRFVLGQSVAPAASSRATPKVEPKRSPAGEPGKAEESKRSSSWTPRATRATDAQRPAVLRSQSTRDDSPSRIDWSPGR